MKVPLCAEKITELVRGGNPSRFIASPLEILRGIKPFGGLGEACPGQARAQREDSSPELRPGWPACAELPTESYPPPSFELRS